MKLFICVSRASRAKQYCVEVKLRMMTNGLTFCSPFNWKYDRVSFRRRECESFMCLEPNDSHIYQYSNIYISMCLSIMRTHPAHHHKRCMSSAQQENVFSGAKSLYFPFMH